MQRLQNVTTTFALFYTIIRWQWPYFTPKAIMTIAGSMGIISSWRRKKQLIYRCMDKSRFIYSYACWKKKYFMYSKAMFISLLRTLWSDQATIFFKNMFRTQKRVTQVWAARKKDCMRSISAQLKLEKELNII